MKAEDLTGEAQTMFESFKSMGLSEEASLSATVGRQHELSDITSGEVFGRLTWAEAEKQRRAVMSRPVLSEAQAAAEQFDHLSASVFGRPGRRF